MQEVHQFNSKTKNAALRMLSNFHIGPLTIEGRNYPTGEAAFPGEKFQTASTAPWIHRDRSEFLVEYATLFEQAAAHTQMVEHAVHVAGQAHGEHAVHVAGQAHGEHVAGQAHGRPSGNRSVSMLY